MLIAALIALLHDHCLYGLCPTRPVQGAAPAHLRVFLPGISLDDISEKFVIGVNGLDMKLLRHHTGVDCRAWVGDYARCGRCLEFGWLLLLLLLMCLIGVRV